MANVELSIVNYGQTNTYQTISSPHYPIKPLVQRGTQHSQISYLLVK